MKIFKREVSIFISKFFNFGIVIIFAVSIVGCGSSLLANRESNPVIQDYANPTPFSFQRTTNVFATTASRRLAIITESKNNIDNKKGTEIDSKKDAVIICAGPPPDVGESVAYQIAAGLKAAGSVTPPQGAGAALTGELAGQYARAVATQIAPLVYRTQGLQLYRDSMYKLCIDRMNGWIKDDDQYNLKREENFKNSFELIKQELPLMQENVKAYFATVKAGDSKVTVDDVAKIIELLKKEGISSNTGVAKKPEGPKKDTAPNADLAKNPEPPKKDTAAGIGAVKKPEPQKKETTDVKVSVDDIVRIIEALKK